MAELHALEAKEKGVEVLEEGKPARFWEEVDCLMLPFCPAA
jgi:hypothetical protein